MLQFWFFCHVCVLPDIFSFTHTSGFFFFFTFWHLFSRLHSGQCFTLGGAVTCQPARSQAVTLKRLRVKKKKSDCFQKNLPQTNTWIWMNPRVSCDCDVFEGRADFKTGGGKKKCLHIHELYVAVLFVSPHQQSGYVISPVTVRVEEGETKKKRTSFGKLKVVYRWGQPYSLCVMTERIHHETFKNIFTSRLR